MTNPLINRVQKNLKRLKKWALKNNVDAFRLYCHDIPEYPFYIDKYQDYYIIFDRRKKDEKENPAKSFQQDHLNELKSVLPGTWINKVRKVQQGADQYEKLSEQKNEIIINEHQAKVKVNLYDYLDTGLFLDHRPMRQKIFEQSKDKKVLNLFCYTGVVSVFAALGGGQVTSVDMSATYLDWAKDNFSINNIELKGHKFVQANAIDYINNLKNEKFELIFLDPPTFSNSKRMEDTFDVQRDHLSLVQNTMKLLSPGGVLYFSNNKRGFKLDSKLSEQFLIKEITHYSIPDDFKNSNIHKCFEIKERS